MCSSRSISRLVNPTYDPGPAANRGQRRPCCLVTSPHPVQWISQPSEFLRSTAKIAALGFLQITHYVRGTLPTPSHPPDPLNVCRKHECRPRADSTAGIGVSTKPARKMDGTRRDLEIK